MSKDLIEAMLKFDEDTIMKEVNERLNDGQNPIEIVRDLQAGMTLVGERFSSGDYFLSELMMSGDLFTRVMAIIEPKLEVLAQEYLGKIVVGTPKGDIHDIGKNIFCSVAKGAGFEVHDLGEDVPVEQFVKAVEEIKPDILGFSVLLTTVFENMKKIVDALVQKGLRDDIRVIIGGGVTTEMVRKYVGADFQTIDAIQGLEICKKWATEKIYRKD